MHQIGEINRLQIQVNRLKRGSGGDRVYVLDNLRLMPALRLTAEGIVGLDGQGGEWLDVHHQGHPDSAFRGSNSISLNFTSHYGRMQGRFGSAISPGCAGENILIETAEEFHPGELTGQIVIITSNGDRAILGGLRVAAPCVPFSRFVLNQGAEPDPVLLKNTLQFLDRGTRGFYSTLASQPVVIRPGDTVWLQTTNS